MSFTFYPPNLTSPKNNNPHYRECSSAACSISHPNHRGPHRISSTLTAPQEPQAPLSGHGRGPGTHLLLDTPTRHPAPMPLSAPPAVTPQDAFSDLRQPALASSSPQCATGGSHLFPWPQSLLLPLPLPPSLACSLKRFPSAYACWSLVWHPSHGLR